MKKCAKDLGLPTSLVDIIRSVKVMLLQCPEISEHRKMILLAG